MDEEIERLIALVNVELVVGNWQEVVALTVPLYERAVAVGETTLADLVQDVHWIAQDALVGPVEVASLLGEVGV